MDHRPTVKLSQAGLSVIAAKDVHEGLQTVATVHPDAIVLHCPLGGLTAADAYAKFRAVTKAPLILLAGADEQPAGELTDGATPDGLVLRRPIRLSALVDALTTLITQADPTSGLGSEVLSVGEVILDERAHAVRVRGQPITLPGKEFELLRVLLGHAGQAISSAGDRADLGHRLRRRPAEPAHPHEAAAASDRARSGQPGVHHHHPRFGYRFAAPGKSDTSA